MGSRMRRKFCHKQENEPGIDFYICDECESMMCTDCMWTSVKTGHDYCTFCIYNLQYDGGRL